MADADTNKTTAAPAGAMGGGGTAAAQGSSAGGSGTADATTDAASRPVATRAATQQGAAEQEEPRYFVDGQAVSKEAWLKAAPDAGLDLGAIPDNYFPPISTKKHGGK